MQKSWSPLRTVAAVCAVALCCIALLFSLLGPTSQTTHAASGSVGSSPNAGPVGATISVSGSGWSGVPDGTTVYFGYSTSSNCSGATIVSGAQLGKVSGGTFSGSFRWPSGTSLITYTVCALIGNTTAPANTYSVLSTSPPQLSISTTTLVVGHQATVTGTNYLPAGTVASVVLLQPGNGGNGVLLGSQPSNGSGSFSLTFTVPGTITGKASIEANAGTALNASVAVTVSMLSPAPTPTPTQGPKPSPTPTATATMTPTATPTMTGTPTATQTTVAQTQNTPASTPTLATGSVQTPTIVVTPSGGQNTSGTPTGTGTTNRPTLLSPLTIGAGAFILLSTALGFLLLLRQRRKKAAAAKRVIPPTGIKPWQGVPTFNDNAALPVKNGMEPIHGGPIQPPMANNPPGSSPPPGNSYATPLAEPFTPLPVPMNGNSGPQAVMLDPAVEAAMRQAQMGLYAAPHQRQN